MTVKSLALASLVLATTFGAAQAEDQNQAARVSIEQRLAVAPAPVVEGRQAAPVASAVLTTAERYVIEHNTSSH